MNFVIYHIIIFVSVFSGINAFKLPPRKLPLYDKIFPKYENREIDLLNVNGFYGLIGPNVNISKTNNLFEFFTGDGMIQGVFIDEGEITPIIYKIKTEKRMFEKKNKMRFSRHFFMMPIYMALHGMGLIPNILGLSNTAILNINSRIFTLFERDFPYEVDVDFKDKKIRTMGKQYIENLKHFSAHSKYDKNNGLVHTIDYNVPFKRIQYSILDENFDHIFRENIKCRYFPIVHDFGLYGNKSVFTDSPICFKQNNIFLLKNPFVLDETSNTYINVYNSRIDKLKTYVYENRGFYIFHYADIKEDNRKIEIMAPIYDHLDFSSLDIEGKYRKLIIYKNTGKIEMDKNDELETMNLDFPIKWGQKVILRNVENKSINGFVVCDGLKIEKKLFYKNICFCGEPQLVNSEKTDYLINIGFKNGNMDDGYLFLIDMNRSNKIHEYKLNMPVNIGFHSIFISNEQ